MSISHRPASSPDGNNKSNALHTALSFACLLLLAGLLLSAAGCKEGDEPVEAAPVHEDLVKVRTVVVQPMELQDILYLPGETEPFFDVTVAAEAEGIVDSIGPVEGQSIEEKQLIATIDLDMLQARLNQAQASANLARELADRRIELRKQGVVSQEDLDEATTNQIVTRNQLREAQLAFDQGHVTSPIAGVINELFVDEGEYVKRGEAVANVVDISTIKIIINVPEMDVSHLVQGQPAMVRIDALPDLELLGMVDFISYKADMATKTFETRIVVDNPDGMIRPGMMSRVALERRKLENAIAVPLNVIIDRGGERLVFVEQDGVAHSRTVTLGIITGDMIQILDGLEPGDHLIVSGHTEVEEGIGVEVQ